MNFQHIFDFKLRKKSILQDCGGKFFLDKIGGGSVYYMQSI